MTACRVGIDSELRADCSAGTVIALAEDAKIGAVLCEALPDHDEIARGVRSDAGLGLLARDEGVDVELRTDRDAGAVVALAEDAIGFLNALAPPHHDELAGRVGGDALDGLAPRRIGVHAELRPDGIPLRPGRGG